MRKILMLILFSLLAAQTACEQTYIPPRKQVSFSGAPYGLNVASVNVVDEYKSSKRPPHVELLSDMPPAEAIKQWVSSRLIAKGQNGYAELVIKDAYITKQELPKQKTGIEGYFTTEQTEQYDGRLEMEIKLYDGVNILPVASIHVVSEDS